MSAPVDIIAIEGLPDVEEGARLGELIARAAAAAGIELSASDVLVVAQKVVSKAEGRIRSLADVEPGEHARALAIELGKDPRLLELVLAESSRIVRADGAVLIVETHSGLICANAGIDSSNVGSEEDVALLPEDPDRSARALRAEIRSELGEAPAVIVSDSFGRPWRLGQAEVAIGCAGLVPLDDWRGLRDRGGRELSATAIAIADEIASAADLARSKVSGEPAILVRGLGRHVILDDGPGAAALRRPADEDLFR